jgi:OOP family OmpA-OmpF porin
MNFSCQQCGAMLERSDALCTKCGARQSVVPQASPPRRFCIKCGAPLEGAKFCTKCGTPVDLPSDTLTTSPVPLATSTSGTEVSPVTNASSSAAPAAEPSRTPVVQSSDFPKVVIVAIGVAASLILAIVAGGIYVVHRARQKAATIEARSEIERTLADRRATIKPAPNGNNQAAVEDLKKKLAALAAAAQDPNTQAAVQDLNRRLAELSSAAQASKQNPNNTVDLDINKRLTALAATANSISQNSSNQTTPAGMAGLASAEAESPATAEPVPIGPVAATGDQAHDWALKYERTVGGPEADLVVRTGDINNLGFGWPKGFDPFSGESTPPHRWPDSHRPPLGEPDGTDRIMIGSGVFPGLLAKMSDNNIQEELVAGQVALGPPSLASHPDGYSGAFAYSCPSSETRTSYSSAVDADFRARMAADCVHLRQTTMPQAIVLPVGELPSKINAVLFQLFIDDFQAPSLQSHFQVSLNATRIPTFEYAINSLDQSGPVGKLVSLNLLPEYWPLLRSGTVKLLIDDPTTHVGDGYAVDFVRILVNPRQSKYQVSLTATVTDADKHTPIAGATVSAALESVATDRDGKCELNGIPAGLVVAIATAPGYDENSVTANLPAGQTGHADIQLHAHQESTAALEQSIAQTGTATIYGIHFDTDSSKLRPDSLPALNAVMGLINNHPGSRWMIAGHTDNQGGTSHNQTLSEARAGSVVKWLTAHGVAASQLAPQGFGASRPVADNATANGRALNRRVEVSLSK